MAMRSLALILAVSVLLTTPHGAAFLPLPREEWRRDDDDWLNRKIKKRRGRR
jgi:hypothetical protein